MKSEWMLWIAMLSAVLAAIYGYSLSKQIEALHAQIAHLHKVMLQHFEREEVARYVAANQDDDEEEEGLTGRD